MLIVVIILKIKRTAIKLMVLLLRNQNKEEKVLESVRVDPYIPLVFARPIHYGLIGIEM